jgi:hypothetical protein
LGDSLDAPSQVRTSSTAQAFRIDAQNELLAQLAGRWFSASLCTKSMRRCRRIFHGPAQAVGAGIASGGSAKTWSSRRTRRASGGFGVALAARSPKNCGWVAKYDSTLSTSNAW